MPRGGFNTTCDLVYGSGHASPGTVYDSRICRLVGEIWQDMSLDPFSLRHYYVTMEGDKPNEAAATFVGHSYTLDFNLADRIAIPSGSAPQYIVLFVEAVKQGPEPDYWRASVALWDDFVALTTPPPPDPGTSCATSPLFDLEVEWEYTIGSGATFWFHAPHGTDHGDGSWPTFWHVSVDAAEDDLTFITYHGVDCTHSFFDDLSGTFVSGTSTVTASYPLNSGQSAWIAIHNPSSTPTTFRIKASVSS